MAEATSEPIVVRGTHAILRVWRNEAPNDDKPEERRPYETLGYVVAGLLELTVNGTTSQIRAGESYVVPQDAPHRYVVRDTLTAVEAIAPSERA